MGLIRVSGSLLPTKEIIQALREFFDKMEPLDIIEGEDQLYRVSKDSMGIVFNDDTYIDVGIRNVPESILNGRSTNAHYIVTEINGIGLENKNYGPDRDDIIQTTFLNRYSNRGPKSKG